jgi:hypothetical protein
MLNSGKKIRALRDKIIKYSNSCVVGKKNSERNKKHWESEYLFRKKNITPPFKLNGRSLRSKR